jgi:ubiquinone/menaquinone biosynthesis C-methylase UbiE
MKGRSSPSLEHWESYYRRGELTTCPVGMEANYSAEIRSAWQSFFAGLGNNARLVDLGTGNGAIALLAKETAAASGTAFEIHGIDRARIQPALDVPHGAELFAGINFHPGVAAEALPFADHSVDAICGQYAIEYTDMARTLREMARVLKPGGRVQFVLHSQESVLFDNAQESLRLARLIFEQLNLFGRYRKSMAAEGASAATRAALSVSLSRAAQELQQAARVSRNPHFAQQILQALGALWQRRAVLGSAGAQSELAHLEREARDSVRRLRDIVGHALSRGDVEKLGRIAAAAGLTSFTVHVQTHAGHTVGWRVTLQA